MPLHHAREEVRALRNLHDFARAGATSSWSRALLTKKITLAHIALAYSRRKLHGERVEEVITRSGKVREMSFGARLRSNVGRAANDAWYFRTWKDQRAFIEYHLRRPNTKAAQYDRRHREFYLEESEILIYERLLAAVDEAERKASTARRGQVVYNEFDGSMFDCSKLITSDTEWDRHRVGNHLLDVPRASEEGGRLPRYRPRVGRRPRGDPGFAMGEGMKRVRGEARRDHRERRLRPLPQPGRDRPSLRILASLEIFP